MRLIPLAAASLLTLAVLPRPARAADPAPLAASRGIVVTAQHLASDVGAQVLRDGGNAVDAAVAVGYALAVTYPAAGNLGGGGFMTIRLADGRTTFLDFREKAPLAATTSMFLDGKGDVVPRRSLDTWLAVGVPGSPAGLEAARVRYGTLPRAALIAPALRLARDGFMLGPGDMAVIGTATDALRRDPAAAAIFLRDGDALHPGDRLQQPDLARSLQRLSDAGPDAFYHGPLGAALVEASRAGGGLITQADLDAYRVRELAPVECDYRGYHVISSPPPSSGGVILCEMLGILGGYDLGAMGFHSAAEVHVLVEAMRHAYRDRNNRLGDPDFVDNPVAHLLDPAYHAAIREGIEPERATPSSSLPAEPPGQEGTNTTHYSVVDGAGNAVSVTYTLNDWFGVRKAVPGTGIVLNNEMDDFTSKPGQPNMFGLVQGAANAVAPGKTPLSSMSPTIITRDGQVAMVIGSPGGGRIITIVLEAIINAVDHGMTVQEAVDAPRVHHQWLPDTVYLERFALSPDTRALLEGRGYRFTDGKPWGVAEGVITGGPTLGQSAGGGPADGSGAGSLTLGAQPAGGALFGGHDVRGGAGAAAGAD
jgi:gamma-glutamyltranspeptidase/glutathione hydrolase